MNPSSITAENDQKTTRVLQVSVGFNPTGRCVKCHDMSQLPKNVAQETLDAEKRVSALFEPSDIHFNVAGSWIGFDTTPFPPPHEKELAVTNRAGTQYFLPVFAHPRSRRQTLSHEVIHLKTCLPDHLLYEPWANIGALLAVGHASLQDPEFVAGNRYYLAALQRAVMLGKNPKMPRQIEVGDTEDHVFSSLKKVNKYVSGKDEDELRKLYRESMHAYQTDDVFWDAAAWQYQNPYLVFDAMIAKKMGEARDPEFLNAVRNKKKIDGIIQLLNDFGTELRPPLNDEGIATLNYNRADFRAILRARVQSRSAQFLDLYYYAALYRHFFEKTQSGSLRLRKTAVKTNTVQEILEAKLKKLDEEKQILGYIKEQAARQVGHPVELGGRPEAFLRSVDQRIGQHQQRLKRVRRGEW